MISYVIGFLYLFFGMIKVGGKQLKDDVEGYKVQIVYIFEILIFYDELILWEYLVLMIWVY